MYILYTYMSPVPGLPPPPMVWSPMVGGGPASYLLGFWQHFWPPASYWLGFCSISDYQPRICLVFAACRTTGIIFTRRMVPLSRPTSGLRSTHTASKYIRANLAMHTNTYIYIYTYICLYAYTHMPYIFIYVINVDAICCWYIYICRYRYIRCKYIYINNICYIYIYRIYIYIYVIYHILTTPQGGRGWRGAEASSKGSATASSQRASSCFSTSRPIASPS